MVFVLTLTNLSITTHGANFRLVKTLDPKCHHDFQKACPEFMPCQKCVGFTVPCALLRVILTSLDGPRAPRDAALLVRQQDGGPQTGQRAAVVFGPGVVIKQRHAADLSGFLIKHTFD